MDGGSRGTAVLRQKSVRVLLEVGPIRRGQPGTDALRLKSFCVLIEGGSDRRRQPGDGCAPTEELSCVCGILTSGRWTVMLSIKIIECYSNFVCADLRLRPKFCKRILLSH
jgi:hypothetical protein